MPIGQENLQIQNQAHFAICLIIVGAYMNILLIIKVKILVTGAHILIYFKHLSFLVYILRLTSYHIALKYKYLNYSYFGIRHIDLINSYKFRSKPHVYPNNVSSSSNTLL